MQLKLIEFYYKICYNFIVIIELNYMELTKEDLEKILEKNWMNKQLSLKHTQKNKPKSLLG
mgnify:CR=1 FL=1